MESTEGLSLGFTCRQPPSTDRERENYVKIEKHTYIECTYRHLHERRRMYIHVYIYSTYTVTSKCALRGVHSMSFNSSLTYDAVEHDVCGVV